MAVRGECLFIVTLLHAAMRVMKMSSSSLLLFKKSETRMILCVCVIISKRSFEPFMCLDIIIIIYETLCWKFCSRRAKRLKTGWVCVCVGGGGENQKSFIVPIHAGFGMGSSSGKRLARRTAS